MDIDEFLESLMKTETPPKFPLSMYYSEGTKYLNMFQYEKGIAFLNEALENDPTDFKSLLKRSKCFIGLGRYEEAIEDANNVLKLYPACAQAIDLKGQVQYLMGDFEGGYLTYSRGRDMRPVNNELRLGKQLCEDALKNALYPNVKSKIKNKDVESLVHAKDDRKKIDNRLKYRKSRRDCFDADVKFLKDLMKDKNLASIHDTCKETMDFIKELERFWVMETPLHSRKKRQTAKMKEIKKSDEGEKQVQICLAAKRRAENELSKGRIDYCISETRKLLRFIESFPKQRGKEKMKFYCDAYHLLSRAYDKAGNSRLAHQYLMKELDVACEFKLLLPQLRANHQLGENYQLARDIPSTIQCLNEVANADVEKLMTEKISAEEGKQLLEAMDWAKNILNCVRMSIRQSIIVPIIDTLNEYTELNANAVPKKVEAEKHKNTEKRITENFSDFGTESEESIKLEKDDSKSSVDSMKTTEYDQKLRRGVVPDDSDKSRTESRAILNDLIREIDTVKSESEEEKENFELGTETEESSHTEKEDSKNNISVDDSINDMKRTRSEPESRRIIEEPSDESRVQSISDFTELSQEIDTISSEIESDGENFELETEYGEASDSEKEFSKSALLDYSKNSMKSAQDEQESRRKMKDVTEGSDEWRAENISDLSELSLAKNTVNSRDEEHGAKSSNLTRDGELNNLIDNNNAEKTEVDNILRNHSEDNEQRDEPNAHEISDETDDFRREPEDEKRCNDTETSKTENSSKSVELQRSRSREIGKQSNIYEGRDLDESNIREPEEESKELGARNNRDAIESSSQSLPVRADTDDSEVDQSLEHLSVDTKKKDEQSAQEISDETNGFRKPEDENQPNNTDLSKTESLSKSIELERSRSGEIEETSNAQENNDVDELNIRKNKKKSKETGIRENEEASETRSQSLPVGEDTEINDSEVEESLELKDSSDSDK